MDPARLAKQLAQRGAILPPGKVPFPHPSKAWIPTSPGSNRLKDYALNADHCKGGAKAALFQQRLGIGRDDWEYLRDQILEGVASAWVRRWSIRTVPHDDPRLCLGLRFQVHQFIHGLDRPGCTILTGWRIDTRMAPFLTTTRPVKEGEP